MPTKYYTYVIHGVRYVRYDDHKILTANNDDYHKLQEQKTQWEQLSNHYEKTAEDCKRERDKLKKQVSSHEVEYAKGRSKYEHLMKVLEERTKELALQNKEILTLRDTIEALKFDRDDAISKLAKAVEPPAPPVSNTEYMKQRVKCEVCGKDLSRNSLRGHMTKMHTDSSV